MNLKDLTEIAKEFIAANPSALITGSLALTLLEFKLRREPEDVDMFLPYGFPLNHLPGMEYKLVESTEEEYEDEYYFRDSYSYKGAKIDVLCAINPKFPTLISDKSLYELPCVNSFEILKFKMKHSFSECTSAVKHLEDLKFFIDNNVPSKEAIGDVTF